MKYFCSTEDAYQEVKDICFKSTVDELLGKTGSYILQNRCLIQSCMLHPKKPSII